MWPKIVTKNNRSSSLGSSTPKTLKYSLAFMICVYGFSKSSTGGMVLTKPKAATPAPDTELPSCQHDRIAPRPSEVLTQAPVGRGTDRGLHTSLRGPDVRLGAGRGPAGWPRGGHHGPGNHLALGDPARPHAHEASMPRGSWGSPTLCFSHTLTI